jgi:hypothetical protein
MASSVAGRRSWSKRSHDPTGIFRNGEKQRNLKERSNVLAKCWAK